MMKIQQKNWSNKIFVNVYAPGVGAPKYIKQILIDLKEKIDSNTVTVGDFNTLLHQWINHLDRKSVRKHWL